MSKPTILLSSSSTQEQKNTRLNLWTYVLMSKTTILLSSSSTQEQKNTRLNLCTYVLMSKHIMLLSKPTKTVCLKTMWEIAKTISNIIGLIWLINLIMLLIVFLISICFWTYRDIPKAECLIVRCIQELQPKFCWNFQHTVDWFHRRSSYVGRNFDGGRQVLEWVIHLSERNHAHILTLVTRRGSLFRR